MDNSFDNEYIEESSQNHIDDDFTEKPQFTSPTPAKNISNSVQEFLKQSNEIQEEIRKLSELCQQISPKKDSFIDEAPQSKDEYDEENNFWAKINSMLETNGFNPINLVQDEYDQESPEISSLTDVMVDVLTDYSNLSRNYSEIESAYRKLEAENKELVSLVEKNKKIEAQFKEIDKINRQLNEKINKYKQELKEVKEKDEGKSKSVWVQPGSDRALNVFKAFMEQEYNPIRENDAKIMGIIQNYEEQRAKAHSDFKKEVEILNNIIKKQKSDLNSISTPKVSGKNKPSLENSDSETYDKLKVLNSVVMQLSLKTYTEIPNALNKIQQVMMTLPGIDRFVKQICEEIMLSPSSRLDEVLDTLKDLKKRLQVLEKFKLSISENLASTHEGEIVEKIKGLNYFCRLFEVRPKDDIINVVEGIFYFVHEIKMFLAVKNI